MSMTNEAFKRHLAAPKDKLPVVDLRGQYAKIRDEVGMQMLK